MVLRAHEQLQMVMQEALGVLEESDQVRMRVECRVELQGARNDARGEDDAIGGQAQAIWVALLPG